MTDSTPIIIPRENVNDESVKLLAWLVADREPVQAGQAIAEIESSKAVAAIESPVSGTLMHGCSAGVEVAVGGVLGHVASAAAVTSAATVASAGAVTGTNGIASPEPAPAAETAPVTVQSAQVTPIETRFSAKAQELLKVHSVDPSRFAGRGLIRADDVRALIDGNPAPADGKPAPIAAESKPPAPPIEAKSNGAIVGATGVRVRSESLPRSKRVEARYLATALHHGLPSVVTVACPTRSLHDALASHPTLHGQMSALIIFEAARLLRSFPFFNAYYADGSVHYYEQVNIGFAVDAEHGLKVPVIRDADAKSMLEIAGEMREFVVDYLNDALSMKSLAGGTFTVTDLSGEGVFAFHPLINQGQSAILGVGAEFFPPGSKEGMFNLILAFDHQISEGRAAAKFLNELKRRLAGYENALAAPAVPNVGNAAADAHCDRCFASLAELTNLKHYLLQTVGAQGAPRYICTRCAMGYT